MLNNLKVSTRLGVVIGVLAVSLLAVGVIGLISLERTNESLKSVYEESMVPAVLLGEIRYEQVESRLAIASALASQNRDEVSAAVNRVDAIVASVAKLWEKCAPTFSTPEERALANAFVEHRKTYRDKALLPAVTALRAYDLKEAQRLWNTEFSRAFAPLGSDVDGLLRVQVDQAKAAYESAEARFETIRAISIAAMLVAVTFGISLGLLITRSIVRALGAEPHDVKALIERVAAGHLSHDIRLRSGDRDSVMASTKTMTESLARTVQAVRESAENVASASAQIASGNTDLAGRTEEQASALQQTASSMEQLGSTVKLNADNARQANQLASGASTVAVSGGEVVTQVVATMKGINDSSKRIEDIISVIDGIAFQTNILALNAAVEAARAGEQGRGFAVVASEVRTLAQRSAGAAREIKTLISESVQRVAEGSVLVDRAGTTMHDVVTAIQRVTDIMGEITNASVEQSAGVSQVGTAIGQMDQSTQQNAALVEESAAAAHNLNLQAQELVKAMAAFTI